MQQMCTTDANAAAAMILRHACPKLCSCRAKQDSETVSCEAAGTKLLAESRAVQVLQILDEADAPHIAEQPHLPVHSVLHHSGTNLVV